jgi:hypothetical protein
MAALVNGLLVFGLPTIFTVIGLWSASRTPWLADISARRPTTSQVAAELLQFALVYTALSAVAAWRTWVHALRYMAGESRGWRGVAEAAACGFAVAMLYLAPGIAGRPQEAPPYVIFYGGAAAILGALVGIVLLASARVVVRLSQPKAA